MSMKTLSFALIEGDVTIQVPHPMTAESFEMLLDILKLQRPALVPPSPGTPKKEDTKTYIPTMEKSDER